MLPSRKDPSHSRPEECYAQDESHRRCRARAGARRRDHGVRRARRRDQSGVLGAFQLAFHPMRSSRPGPVLIDLPFDVQMAAIEFDPDTYEPLPVYKPKATVKQIEKALAMLNDADRPVIIAGGGIINADASE